MPPFASELDCEFGPQGSLCHCCRHIRRRSYTHKRWNPDHSIEESECVDEHDIVPTPPPLAAPGRRWFARLLYDLAIEIAGAQLNLWLSVGGGLTLLTYLLHRALS
jgi:hypothetical protein